MMRWLHWLRVCWLCLFRLPGPTPRSLPRWTRTDSEQLHAFLTSQTGSKLLTMLEASERTQDAAALSSRDAFACGIAWGWKAHNNWVLALARLTLSAAPEPQIGDEHDRTRAGASDPGERWAP